MQSTQLPTYRPDRYLPAAHDVHEDEPEPEHVEHELEHALHAPELKYLPAAHDVHEDEPEPEHVEHELEQL